MLMNPLRASRAPNGFPVVSSASPLPFSDRSASLSIWPAQVCHSIGFSVPEPSTSPTQSNNVATAVSMYMSSGSAAVEGDVECCADVDERTVCSCAE